MQGLVHKAIHGTKTQTWCGAVSYHTTKLWMLVTCPVCREYKDKYNKLRKGDGLTAKIIPSVDINDPEVLNKLRKYFGRE